MTNSDLATPRLRVAFVQADTVQAQVPLEELWAILTESPLLEAGPNPEAADLWVDVQNDAVYKFYVPGQPVALAAFRIPVKRAQSLPRRLQKLLEHVAAYRNLLDMAPPTQALKSAVKVEFLQLLEPASRKSMPEVGPLPRNDAGELVMQSGQNLAISFSHSLPSPLNCYVFSLNSQQQSVNLVYPYQRGLPAKVRPNEMLLIGSGPQYLVEMQLGEGEATAVDIFKLWVSSSPIEPSVVTMPPLSQRLETPTDPYGTGSRLDRDLRRVLLGIYGVTPLTDFAQDPWWCQQQAVRVVRG